MQIDLSQINWKQTGLYFIIGALLGVLLSKCENEKKQLANVKALTSELSSYKLKNGQLVVSAEALVYTNKELEQKVLAKDTQLQEMAKKFSTIKAVTKYVNKIRIDTINVVYKDSVPCVFEKTGSVATKDYSLNYKTNQAGLSISDLSIENNVSIITGIKRKWFLGKETQTVSVTNSNSLIKMESLQNIEIKKTKRFWDTNLFKIGLGFVAGVSLVK